MARPGYGMISIMRIAGHGVRPRDRTRMFAKR